MPTRIQRKRTRGWRAPEGAKYVGRGTRYGNPWAVVQTRTGWAVNWTRPGKPQPEWEVSTSDQYAAQKMAVGLYGEYLAQQSDLVTRARRELAGHDLMCWCPEDQPCHADILLRVASIPDGAGVCVRCWHWEGQPDVHRACPDCGRPWDHILPKAAP